MTPNANPPGFVAGRPLREWDAAYLRVESYFQAFRVENKLLLARLVSRVLDRAIERASREAQRTPMDLAVEEMDRLVTEWFMSVLAQPSDESDQLLSLRARMALLLADMPGRWQDQFLKPPPWPEPFVSAMRDSFLQAGPDFQLSRMEPRPIDLGVVTTVTTLGNLAWLRMAAAWIFFAGTLVAIFHFTR